MTKTLVETLAAEVFFEPPDFSKNLESQGFRRTFRQIWRKVEPWANSKENYRRENPTLPYSVDSRLTKKGLP